MTYIDHVITSTDLRSVRHYGFSHWFTTRHMQAGMTAQLEFPLARKTDPHTSHEAAHALVESGAHQRQVDQVLAALTQYPNRTSAELAAEAGFDRYMVARRLSDLEKRNKASKHPARICTVSKRRAVVWRTV
jgi:hypothetical protein